MRTNFNRRNFLGTAGMVVVGTALAESKGNGAMASESEPADSFRTKLKKAFCFRMFPGEMPLEDRFKLARDIGLDGVEVKAVDDPKQVERIKIAAENASIEIHSVMNIANWKYPFSSDNPSDISKGIKGMETSLQTAKAWGADTVLLVPAVVNPKTSYRDAYMRSQTHIHKLLPLAKEMGIVIAIENVWNKFLLSPLEFARYVDEFDSPYLQAYFDVGNIVLYGYPQDWIRTLKDRIRKFHIKGFDAERKQFVNIRDGSIDWPDVRRAIDEIGYSGYITAELSQGNESYLRDVSKRIDLIISGN